MPSPIVYLRFSYVSVILSVNLTFLVFFIEPCYLCIIQKIFRFFILTIDVLKKVI